MHPSAGGPPVVVDQWCAGLVRMGYDSGVLTTDAYADGSDVSWVDAYRVNYPIEVLPLCGPKGFGFSPTFRRSLRKKLIDCDLVHVHNLWGYCNQVASSLCVKMKVPYVVSTHGMLDPHSMGRKPWKKQLYGRLFEWKSLRNAAGIVFTHAEEERLARESCSDLPRGFVVPLGTEEPPARTRAELTEQFLNLHPELRECRRVVFLSRLHSKKGLDLLLPAFRTVLHTESAARLVLVGPGEPNYVAELKAICIRLGIVDRVVFTGPLQGDAKWAALAAADVYVLPSYQENFAIALVEALRVSTPVICSRRVNLWSDLRNASAATICDLTVESVAQSILGQLQDPVQAQAQGHRGAAYAAANYTWAKSVDRLMAVYARVTGQR